MTPDDPRHGTNAGYHRHVRDGEDSCSDCHRAMLRDLKRRTLLRPRGLVGRTEVSPTNRAKIDEAREMGLTWAQISAQVGVTESALWHIGNTNRKIRVTTQWALNAWTPRAELTHIGMVRRVHALAYLGYTAPFVAKAAGVGAEILQEHHLNTATSTPQTRAAIAAVYDRLHMIPLPRNRTTSRSINMARRLGWAPPLAWDDDTIDNPAAKPSRGAYTRHNSDDHIDEPAVERRMAGDRTVTLTKAERAEVVARLKERGESASIIEKRHGLNARRDIA